MTRYGKLTRKVVLASVIGTGVLNLAHADIVYDEATAPAAAAATTTVTTTTVSTEPVVVDGSVQKASDKAKDKRTFQESMNNELVIQRLEEKRLKEEEKLTKEINKRFSLDDESEAASVGTAAPVAKEEVTIKPITEGAAVPSAYQMAPAPQYQQSQVQPIQDTVKSSQSSVIEGAAVSNASTTSVADAAPAQSSGTRIGLTPRFGLATMTNAGYDFNSRYVLGAGAIFDVTRYVSLEAGYQYSEYGVRLGSAYSPTLFSFGPQELVFRNNTIDMNMRLYLTNNDSAIRPYVGAGAAYSWGYLNYGRRTFTTTVGNNLDYELTQFQGLLTGGLEFKISKTITIGANYKFLRALSSTENESLNNQAFLTSPIVMNDANKSFLRGSIRDSDVHQILLGASLYF